MTGKTRESNIELLRILAICGVVVLHYNGNVAFSHVAEGSVNYYILNVLEVMCICAVDLFVLISGFFLSHTTRRRTVKALELVIQVMVIGAGKYLLTCIAGGQEISLRSLAGAVIPNNYFVTLYITLYLLPAYINLALAKLTDRQYGILTGLCVVLFSIWPTVLDVVGAGTGYVFNGLYTTNSGGSQYGYSLLNFMLMYLIGGYLARVTKKGHEKSAPWAALWAGSLCGLILWQLFQPQTARSYCNPLVIGEAVALFMMFQNLRFHSRAVNTLAKSAFTCFLLHDVFWWYIGIEKAVAQTPLVMAGHILLTVLLIFLASWLVWKLYDWVTGPVFRWIGKKFARLDKIISVGM